MQISLFSEDDISRKADRRFSLIKNYEYKLADNQSKEMILLSTKNTRDEIFISSIKYALNNDRASAFILGASVDTHFNLETMNVSKRSKGYVVVYSINNLLPVIFNILCGSDIKKVSECPGIDEISDSILNLNLDKTLYVDSLIKVDENLDRFLASYFTKEDYDIEHLKEFVCDVNFKAIAIIKYIVSHLETYSNLLVLSVDKSRILLSSEDGCPPILEVEFGGFKYRLNPYVPRELNGFHKESATFNFCEVIGNVL